MRDKHARLCNLTNGFIDQLLPTTADYTLRDVCHQLVSMYYSHLPCEPENDACDKLGLATETPEMQQQIVSSHGLLAILEVLESNPSRDVAVDLLRLTNIVRSSSCHVSGAGSLKTPSSS